MQCFLGIGQCVRQRACIGSECLLHHHLDNEHRSVRQIRGQPGPNGGRMGNAAMSSPQPGPRTRSSDLSSHRFGGNRRRTEGSSATDPALELGGCDRKRPAEAGRKTALLELGNGGHPAAGCQLVGHFVMTMPGGTVGHISGRLCAVLRDHCNTADLDHCFRQDELCDAHRRPCWIRINEEISGNPEKGF